MTQTSVVSEERRLGIRELLAFTGMALGMFLAVLNIQIVGSSFDQIKAGLAAGSEEVSWVLTSALMAEVIMIPMSGWLCRLMSTRWLFTGCLLGFGLASIGCALATSIEQMIIFRAAQGFMGGGLAPMIWAAIYVSFPRRYQNYLLAIVSLLGTSAVALGPSLGGWISEEMSWPWLFYFSVPFAALSAAMVFFFVDFDMPDWSIFEDIDVLGILLMATFFMCLLIVLEEGRRQDWLESRLIVILATISAISGLLFVWRELTCSNPLIDLRVFGHLNFSVGAFYVAVFGAGMYVPLYLLPLFLSRIIGLNTWQIGSML
ncbi:MAG TPA: DHA2 family efflux MFS transporter permease subunit, partial [Alphaproteobacteria bacterium]|nr:DHA2 family efflux MFS transporter permease subunit [Alphaproteobacteria bacterium]